MESEPMGLISDEMTGGKRWEVLVDTSVSSTVSSSAAAYSESVYGVMACGRVCVAAIIRPSRQAIGIIISCGEGQEKKKRESDVSICPNDGGGGGSVSAKFVGAPFN
jgi:hypothetical protein